MADKYYHLTFEGSNAPTELIEAVTMAQTWYETHPAPSKEVVHHTVKFLWWSKVFRIEPDDMIGPVVVRMLDGEFIRIRPIADKN